MRAASQATASIASISEIESIYREHYPRFLRFAVANLGDVEQGRDAVHETFVRAIRSLDDFRGEGRLESWLWRILANVCLVEKRHSVAALTEAPRAAPVVETEDWPELRAAITALPDRQRAIARGSRTTARRSPGGDEMSNDLTSILGELVPRFEDERGDWARVLADARVGERSPERQRRVVTATSIAEAGRRRIWPGASLTRRRLALIAALVTAIALPIIAGASQNWWFFRFPDTAPEPITDVTVVESGTWDGQPWQLVAYLSVTDGICFGLSPTGTAGSTGEGAALSCDQIEGVPRTEKSKPYSPHAITFLAGSSPGPQAYVVGPVVDTADEVAIYLNDGTVIRTPTFSVSRELGSIRFYATQVPEPERTPGERPGVAVQKLVGFGDEGEIVACLVVPMPEEGVALSACQ